MPSGFQMFVADFSDVAQAASEPLTSEEAVKSLR